MPFTHLHTHSHYSLLDGLSKIDPLVERAKNLGMDALALTDHGVMYGAIEFYNKCREAGVKPIIGMEAYISPRRMTDREGKIDADYFHLTLLAKSFTGYKNLMMLSTRAHTEGFYYKPRVDVQLLARHAEGLIALSGCQRGEVARALGSGSRGEARPIVEKYQSIFGPENFYIELQRNSQNESDEQNELNGRLREIARDCRAEVVATQDSHYLDHEDAEAQDVLICIGTGRTVDDADRLDMKGHDLSLRSPADMARIFSDVPEAIANTSRIADACRVEIPTNQRYFATVDLPAGKTAESFLTETVWREALIRYGGAEKLLPPDTEKRIAYELDIICQKGFAPYFLMVADIVRGAKSIGAITNTRGSAAGSIVGYILGISIIDPLYYQLPFERFLTVHRPTPPDVDLDISDNRRDEAIEWITNKYGSDKVAQIITFGTMMARAAIRDVGRALGVSYGKCDRLAKMVPLGKQGFHMTLDRALEMNAELAQAYAQDSDTKRILDVARRLEGCARHASIHAAALAITPTPLTDYTPLQKEPDGERLITQYDMYSLDVGADSHALGVIKLDLLGIRNLSILEESVRLVEKRHGKKIDIYNLPHPDPKTFTLLSDGLTFGVFQLGSSGMTRYLKELRPQNIFDVSAMIALYRPGPMGIIPEYIARRHNPKLIQYFDPRMKDYLERSLGLLVYQDDVLLTAINIAGYSWEEADGLRKAMGKKIPAEMSKQKVKFIDGCMKGGMNQQDASELFALIEPFAAYGFGKAHAASYSQVSYQTAFMKANYPVEFMAAVMTAESGDETKIYAAVEECKNLGIKVLPPDVSQSYDDFTVVDEHTIRFGLGAIKNLGSDVITQIKTARSGQTGSEYPEAQRSKLEAFSSLEDFLIRCHTKNLNKKSWEALVKAGALDAFGERGLLLANTETVLSFLRDYFKATDSGQNSLFAGKAPVVRLVAASPARKDELLAWEKEHLGMYVSAHPLDSYATVLNSFVSIRSLSEDLSMTTVVLGGIINKLKRTLTKKNEPMAFFTLEDRTGSVEVLVFPKLMPQVVELLQAEKIIQVSGKVTDRDGEIKIIADGLSELPSDERYLDALSEMEKSKEVVIHMNHLADEDALRDIKIILENNPGNAQVYLSVGTGAAAKRIKTKTQVRLSKELLVSLKSIPQISHISES